MQPQIDNLPLNFTSSAAGKVGQLIEKEGNLSLKLRVYIQGGGCSGFSYGFTFDEFFNIDFELTVYLVNNILSCALH